MTTEKQQHRATKQSRDHVAMMPSEGTIQGMLADCIGELFSRVETLEAAQASTAPVDDKIRRLLAELAEWVDDETRHGDTDELRHELVLRAREVLGAEPFDVVVHYMGLEA